MVVVLSDAFPKMWSFFHGLFIIDFDSACFISDVVAKVFRKGKG